MGNSIKMSKNVIEKNVKKIDPKWVVVYTIYLSVWNVIAFKNLVTTKLIVILLRNIFNRRVNIIFENTWNFPRLEKVGLNSTTY